MVLTKSINNKLMVLASHNTGKIKEFKSLFSNYSVKIITSSELGINDVEETGNTFEENAIIKARSIPEGKLSISDDSGLCIEGLENYPGIFSSRYADRCGGWYEAMEKLYKDLIKVSNNNFKACFHSVIAIRWENNEISTFAGTIEGKISWPPKGDNGFGYDPFFIPDGQCKTFGEIKHEEKIKIDHRFKAFEKLAKLHLIDN